MHYLIEEIMEDCKDIAVQAGKAIMDVYNQVGEIQVNYKQDNSPLTEADRLSNKIIVDALKRKYKKYAILCEEEADDSSRLYNDYCFIIDPLDGTKEFIKRNGQFTVNIGLSYKHDVILGVIYAPYVDELYYARKGKGAYLQKSNAKTQRIHASDITSSDELRIVMSNSHNCLEMESLLKKHCFKEKISIGSSLKGCLIARGDAELYYRYNPTMEWDTAAMQCIVEEAGAVFRQMDGSEMKYNRRNCRNDKGFYIVNRIENIIN